MSVVEGCCDQSYVCAQTGDVECRVHGGFGQCCAATDCPSRSRPSRSEVWRQQIQNDRYRAFPLAALKAMSDHDLGIASQAFHEGAGVAFWWVKDDPARNGTPINPYGDEVDRREEAAVETRPATAVELRRARREARRIYGLNIPGWLRRRRLRKRFTRPH